MKVVFLLFDSLNRHALSRREPTGSRRPNFERLAARSAVCERRQRVPLFLFMAADKS